MSIDLEALTKGKVHNLSGHERGLAARALFSLDELDVASEPIEIHVPDYVYGISPSFVQGFLSSSLQSFDSNKSAFLDHYKVIASDLIKRQFDRGVSAILTDREFPAI
ncbi:MAG: hypothetical protein AAGB23_14260 [Pseudomonadota bacterium]